MTAAGTIAGMQASRSSARASRVSGWMEQQASQQQASQELMVAGLTASRMTSIASDTATRMETSAGKTAEQMTLAANLEREAANKVYAAQSLAVDYTLQSAADTRKIADAQLQLGQLEYQASDFRAGQMEEQGQLEQATASYQAQDTRRQEHLADSALVARAAASGGGASDPTVLRLRAGLEQRGEMAAMMQMFSGERARYEGRLSAAAERLTGNAKLFEATGNASATLASADAKGREALGQLALAQAGLTVADATRARELALIDAQRQGAFDEATKLRATTGLDAMKLTSQAALDASRLTSAGGLAAYKGSAQATIATQQGYASLFNNLSSGLSAFSKLPKLS
jgi:hypothetical protein